MYIYAFRSKTNFKEEKKNQYKQSTYPVSLDFFP